MNEAIYLYCIVRSARKPAMARVPPGLPGAGRPSLEQLADSLWLVVAAVPLDRYGEGALADALRDLDWVSGIALAHEAVVEHFARARGATVIPMKLFTMFSNVDRAIARMRSRCGHLERVFDRIEGCEEWAVRVTRADRLRPSRRTSTHNSGTAFLAARKKAREDEKAALEAAAEAADAAFLSLSAIARDQRRRLDEMPGVVAPLVDAAFLVPARRRARFRAVAARLAGQVARSGGRLTVTGPWPPYNFVSEEAP